ncbi:hypothetical protein JCM9957A_44620 [Kineosporia succinea]
MAVKPTVVGYQRALEGPESADVIRGRHLIAAFAAQESYTLSEIFEESDPTQPSAALSALLDVVHRLELRVVIVPNVFHLGRTAWTQQATRRQIERAGARVDVAESVPSDGERPTGGCPPNTDVQSPARVPATPTRRQPRPRLVRRVPPVARSVWTGRMDVVLSDLRDVAVGALSLVVRLDHVFIWQGSRLLAVLDRDHLRNWLRRPLRAFAQDDVTLSRTQRGRLHLLVDGSTARLFSRETVQQLAGLV